MTLKEFITLLGFETDPRGLEDYDKALDRSYRKVESMDRGFKKFADNMTSIGNRLTLFLTTPIIGTGVASFLARNKMEDLRTEWELLLGSKADAEKFVDTVEQMKVPFERDQILAYTKYMHSLGTEQGKLLSDFQKYADISAGTGYNPETLIGRFNMMRNMAREVGYIMGRDLKGLIRSGILNRAELRSLIGTGDVRKIPSQIKMDAEQVDRLLSVLGKKYEGYAARRANTTNKAINNLKDAFFIFAAAIGDVLEKKLHLTQIIRVFTRVVENATKWVENLSEKKKGWIIVIAGLLALLGPAITSVGLLMKGFVALRGAMVVFGAGAAATGWIALITAGILGLLVLLDDLYFWIKKGAEHSFYGTAIMGFFKMVADFSRDLFDQWLSGFNSIAEWVNTIVKNWLAGIDTIISYFKEKWTAASDWYLNLPGISALVKAGAFLHQNVASSPAWVTQPSMMAAGMSTGVHIGEILVNIPNASKETVDMVTRAVKESATSAYDKVIQGITNSIYNQVKK